MTTVGSARRGRFALHWESTGSGDTVLLIAGLAMTTTGWWRTMPVLAARFRVIAFDNRGVGLSSPLHGIYTTEAMAEDAIAVLDAAGVDAAHVYGFSLGGMVAQCLAVRAPDRVRSLILGATHAGGRLARRADGETLAFFRRRVLLPPEEAAWASVPYAYGPGRLRHADRIAEDIERRLRLPVEPRTYRAQMVAAVNHDCRHRLRSIRAPALVVHGAEDRMIPVANGEQLAGQLPHARLHVVAGAGHFYATDEPETDERIAEFLLEKG